MVLMRYVTSIDEQKIVVTRGLERLFLQAPQRWYGNTKSSKFPSSFSRWYPGAYITKHAFISHSLTLLIAAH